jgi:two-component system sensor histidine kinase KdpD
VPHSSSVPDVLLRVRSQMGRADPAADYSPDMPAEPRIGILPLLLPVRRPATALGVLAALIGVAAATGAIYPLKTVAPVVSLSVVYLPVVLLLATVWGLWLGLATSVLSAAAFNFFQIPPVGRFTIADSKNWVALAAFTTVAVVASAMSELARARSLEADRRRAEADLAATLARELLGGGDSGQALAMSARRLTAALGLSSAALELGVADGDTRRRAIPLRDDAGAGAQLATLLVPRAMPSERADAVARIVPALAALVAISVHRAELQNEQVETAALRRSDDVKTAVLRAVSHDLRTPLTALVATGHALQSDSLTQRDRTELAGAVVEESKRLSSLVEKLLDLSRLQAGSAAPSRDWVSVEDVLSAAVDGLALEPDPADVRTTIETDLPEVRADAVQLERVFANLLENAARFSPTVSVAARHSGDRVMVSVVDRGPGISVAERERIFEPFYRGPSASGNGSGLGLAIAKGFVEAGGGTLTVDSLPGQGASFTVSLPIEGELER